MMQETNNTSTLFPRLSDEVLQHLKEYGTEIDLEIGECLFREGDRSYDFHVVLDGEIIVTKKISGQEQTLATHQKGEFIGELSILTDADSIASGYATVASRILKLEQETFKQVIAKFPFLADIFISTLAARTKIVEQQLQQQEQLASLGKLSAGIAHELKNPAAAAARVADELLTRFQISQNLSLQLHQSGLNSQQLDFLSDFITQLQTIKNTKQFDILAQNHREDEITEWLEEHEVDPDGEMVSTLVDAGLDSQQLDNLSAQIPDNTLGIVVAWLAANLTTMGLIKEVKQSSDRISELVKSVKSYAHTNQAQLHQVDIHEGIENTLTMLRHKLKDGIKVIREYGQNLPVIQTSGSELNQVWTNLIDNAVDALEGKGNIFIRTSRNNKYVIVEIADNGPGIPPEIQSRIFEPFFTTKGVGKGSGLGLDIINDIVVKKHRGEIKLKSKPGNTSFQIFLPI
ncbi:ATP-binding protein [Okeanomitos corallinicola TIOX110]|uniref:histidine kinase n=1 Tax=Okeanomitos corallinicola TIOX110 TaxID=3133117 RepID=A0ABZ2UWG2_9CYAN